MRSRLGAAMPKTPSAETELRKLRRELRAALAGNSALIRRYSALRDQAEAAEREAAEWRKRFDDLLGKVVKCEVADTEC